MKFKLPKALLVAVLTSTVAQAAPFIAEEANIISTPENTTLSAEQKSILEKELIADSTNTTPKPVIKYGEGSLSIEEDITLNNPLLIREGTVEIKNSTVTSMMTKPLTSYVPYLSVGGNNASLKLDNAVISHNSADTKLSAAALVIGMPDGGATVTLDNKSTLHTDHFLFAGDVGGMGTEYDYVKQVNNEPESYSGDGSTKSTINILNRSTMSAGTSLQFSNVTVNIDGEGSCLSDNTLGKSPDSPANVDPCTYLAYDGADNVETIINVTGGAHLDCNWNVSTGKSKDSLTQITVDGTNEGGTVKSTFSVAGTADFGGAEGWWSMNNAPKDGSSNTEVIVKNGAEAQFNQVKVGSNRQASISIDSNSTIVAHEGATNALITVYELGTIENSGIIELDITVNGGTYLGDGDADQFGGSVFTILDGSVVEGLTMTTGTVNISGEVSLTNVTFGTEPVAMYSLMTLSGESDALTLNISDGAVINADELVINETATINMVLSEDNTGSITITGTDASKVSALKQQLEATMNTVDSTGATVDTGSVSITTNVVPEPATATLSLLALCGLCARRRRK